MCHQKRAKTETIPTARPLGDRGLHRHSSHPSRIRGQQLKEASMITGYDVMNPLIHNPQAAEHWPSCHHGACVHRLHALALGYRCARSAGLYDAGASCLARARTPWQPTKQPRTSRRGRQNAPVKELRAQLERAPLIPGCYGCIPCQLAAMAPGRQLAAVGPSAPPGRTPGPLAHRAPQSSVLPWPAATVW